MHRFAKRKMTPANNVTPVQLPLGIRLRADATFDNFVVGPNRFGIEQVRALATGQNPEQLLYIHGHAGVGCTYLLQACCHLAEESGRHAVYLPLEELIELSVDALESLESFDLICIDHIEIVAGRSDWEEAVFHLFNRIREQNRALLIAGQNHPDQIGIKLADLRTRLNWGVVVSIRDLDDSQKIEALKKHASTIGLNLSEEVVKFLLKHNDRNLGELFRLIDRLDQRSLSEKRRITVPFIKQVMGWI